MRAFECQTAKPQFEVFNGIHPGKPKYGPGANETRFWMTTEQLMPEQCTSFLNPSADYNWWLQSDKQTLKEFEKDVYYQSGEYEKAYTHRFRERLDLGYHLMDKKQERDDFGPGHYIRDQPGFRDTVHLDTMGGQKSH